MVLSLMKDGFSDSCTYLTKVAPSVIRARAWMSLQKATDRRPRSEELAFTASMITEELSLPRSWLEEKEKEHGKEPRKEISMSVKRKKAKGKSLRTSSPHNLTSPNLGAKR